MATDEQIERMMNRIAVLEKERSTAPKGPDMKELARLATLDPNAFYKALGLSKEAIDHIQTIAVVNTLGDAAPLQMKMAAMQGPNVIAAQNAQTALADLSRRFDELEKRGKTESLGSQFKAITADTSKYPHLSKMLTAKPDRFNAELAAHGGSIEEFAAAKEADLAILVGSDPAAAPQGTRAGATPAASGSVNNPDNQAPSTKGVSAPLASRTNTTPAPGAGNEKPEGAWSREAFEELKQRIVNEQ